MIRRIQLGGLIAVLLLAGCTKRAAQTPPAPLAAKNIFVLLPEPDGKASGITVRNAAGAQSLGEPYQAVRVARNDITPEAPFQMDPAEANRIFGAALDALPEAEVQFTLYFDEGLDALTPESERQLAAISDAVRNRQSTAVTVIGHTDTTGDAASNYELGLKRAQRVAAALTAGGLPASNVFVTSHGDTDLLVKTAHGVSEPKNRRVEVIVR